MRQTNIRALLTNFVKVLNCSATSFSFGEQREAVKASFIHLLPTMKHNCLIGGCCQLCGERTDSGAGGQAGKCHHLLLCPDTRLHPSAVVTNPQHQVQAPHPHCAPHRIPSCFRPPLQRVVGDIPGQELLVGACVLTSSRSLFDLDARISSAASVPSRVAFQNTAQPDTYWTVLKGMHMTDHSHNQVLGLAEIITDGPYVIMTILQV